MDPPCRSAILLSSSDFIEFTDTLYVSVNYSSINTASLFTLFSNVIRPDFILFAAELIYLKAMNYNLFDIH